MRLADELARRLDAEQSYFRQHLIREDVGRLERLAVLAQSHPDVSSFVAAGSRIGWTPDDRRTHELRPALEPLLHAVHERLRPDVPVEAIAALDARIAALWAAFEALRLDRLVGCLSRVPRPQVEGSA